MIRVAIANLAGRIAVSMGDADDCTIMEFTLEEAIRIADVLDHAIFALAAGRGTAPHFAGFLEGFEG